MAVTDPAVTEGARRRRGGGQRLEAGTENFARSVHCCAGGGPPLPPESPDTSLNQDAALSPSLADGAGTFADSHEHCPE